MLPITLTAKEELVLMEIGFGGRPWTNLLRNTGLEQKELTVLSSELANTHLITVVTMATDFHCSLTMHGKEALRRILSRRQAQAESSEAAHAAKALDLPRFNLSPWPDSGSGDL